MLATGLSSTGIARGSGISSSSADNRYNASGWTNNFSLSTTDYFSLPITPDPGYHINFNNFVYTGQRSSSGPTSFAFRHSSSSFGTNIGSPTSTGTTITLTGASYQNITAATEFRFYGWSSSGGTFSINDFTFNGSVLGTTVESLTGFSTCINTASTAQSFVINGTGLIPASGNITIAPSANYEISVTSATSGFLGSGSATVAYTGGNITKTVWVRLKANAVAGTYNSENINVSGGGFSSSAGIDVTCSGTVNGNSTLSLTSALGTDNQTKCINTAITNITYLVGGSGTGASVTGLPAGVTGSYNAGTKVYTISGSPTASGTFNYTVTTAGPCSNTSLSGTIEVSPNATLTLTSGVGSNNQTRCINNAISDITYSVGGTGNNASVSGLPAGVTGVYNAGVFTISGTPTASGTFNFTVTATGTCGNATATGTLTINANSTLAQTSASGTESQTKCINTAITNITYLVGGSGTGATVTGLPSGVTGSYNAGTKVYTISGSPTASGTFNYTVTTTGPCENVSLNGTINVTAASTITLTSGVGSNIQTRCIDNAITNITYLVGGTATGAGITAGSLPAGVTGVFDSETNIFTISGTPTASGTFNYTVSSTGPCPASLTGTITVNANSTITQTSASGTENQTKCINTAITNITYLVGGGGTGVTVTGLPSGLNGNYNSGTKVYTISGSPTVSGTFNYTVTTTGPCINTSLSGTVTVTANATISLSSAPGTSTQTVCQNSSITDITYVIGGSGTGASVTGLPSGVTGVYDAGVFTISGAPTATGTFTYTVTSTGPCVTPSLGGTITVNTLPAVSVTATPATICIGQSATLNASNTGGNVNYVYSGSNNTSVNIPDGSNASYSYSSINLAAGAAVLASTDLLQVTVNISHGNVGDLDIFLVDPSGTRAILLSSDNGGTGNNYTNTVFSTAASNVIGSTGNTTAPFTGTYRPEGTLTTAPDRTGATFGGNYNSVVPANALAGASINGNWTLRVFDDAFFNSGNLTGWSLSITQPGAYTSVFNGPATLTPGTPSGINANPTATVTPPVGVHTYTVTTTDVNGCSTESDPVTVTVEDNGTISLSSAELTDAQTVCINNAITDITYTVGGNATGAQATGLPAGVSAVFNAGILTISGTPTVSGTFNYTVQTTGSPCVNPSLNGTITVNADATITLSSSTGTDGQTVCINTAITDITYLVGGSGTSASVFGLPNGLNAVYSAGVLTISGTPTESGVFGYTVFTSGPCVTPTLSGTVTVTGNGTISLGSGSTAQELCINTAIGDITYDIGGTATGAQATGLPNGVTAVFNAGVLTISGTPTESGNFSYTVTTTGSPCVNPSLGGTITVNPNLSAGNISGTSPLCIGQTATYSTDGDAGGTWSSNNESVATVDPNTGLVTANSVGSATITYTISTGCGTPVSASASVTVNPNANAGTVSGTSPLCIGQSATYSSDGDLGGTWSSNNESVATVDPNTGSVTAISAGTATITYTVSTGCYAPVSASASVTVNPNANAGTISGTSPLCIGQSATYSSDGDLGGTWSSNNESVATVDPNTGSVTAIAAGTATITYTVSTGCNSPVSASASVTVNPNANAGTVSGTSPLCIGQSTAYSSDGDLGGTWSSNNESVATVDPNTGSVTAISAGTATITYTVSTGCYAPVSASASVTVNPNANAGTVSGTSPLCIGQSTTYSSDGDLGGTWSSNNESVATVDPNTGSVTAIAAGTATITYTVSTGCNSPVIATTSVTVNPNANAGTVSGTSPLCIGQSATYSSDGDLGGTWSSNNESVATVDPNTGSVTAIAAGTATITYTVSTGCNSPVSASASVTVNPNANAGTVSGTSPLCIGQSATYSSDGDLDGTWSSNNESVATVDPNTGSVTAISAGTATITYTVSTGCYAPVSASASVTVNPNANAGTVSGTSPLCIGQSATYSSDGDLGGTWSSNNESVATVDPNTGSVTAIAAGTATITYTVSTGCNSPVSATANVTVNARPTAFISGSANYCQGTVNTSTNLTLTFTGSGPWNYTISGGDAPITGTTSSNPLTVTVTPSSATAQVFTYTVTDLSDANCTSNAGDLTGSATVTINPLAVTPTATVTQPTCAIATGSITITAPLGAGNSYTLDGTTTITWPSINFTGVTPGNHTITVVNSFGCSAPAAASVTVDPQPFTPGAPVVSGLTNVCPFVGVAGPAGQVTYTATATGNGTQTFNWTLPPNTTLVSGQGTNTIVVSFAPGFTSQANKQIRLTVSNQCGTSAQVIYYLLTQYPSTPAPITASATNVCAVLGTNTPITFTIPKAVGAVNYIWSSQAGTTTITSVNGPGANDTSVTVTFASGFTTSAITVQAVNSCGVSGTRSITITRANPATPGLISGPTNVCAYIAPGPTATYSIAVQPTVTNYTWTLPAGATNITYSGATNNQVSFNYPTGYSGGTISVVGTNGCGTSNTPRSLAVATLSPATPSVIDVINTVTCADPGPDRVYTYSLSGMPANATSVNWTIPAAGTITSGQGTASITVSYPPTSVTGTITVVSVNNCGSSVVRSLEVKLPACPPEFAGTYGDGNMRVKPLMTKPATDLAAEIFPNPTTGEFRMKVNSLDKNSPVTVRILDMQGRELKRVIIMPESLESFGSNLKAGSYLAEILQGSQRIVQKLIKL